MLVKRSTCLHGMLKDESNSCIKYQSGAWEYNSFVFYLVNGWIFVFLYIANRDLTCPLLHNK